MEKEGMMAVGRQSGQMLLEIALGLSILVVLLLGAAATINLAIVSHNSSREYQAASNAASSVMAQIAATPFEDVATTWDNTTFDVTDPTGTSLLQADNGFFPQNIDGVAGNVDVVADPDSTGSTTLLEVRITVAWKSVDGTNQRLDYVTRIVELAN